MSILRNHDKQDVLAGMGVADETTKLNEHETLSLALSLEVNLDVDTESLELIAEPEEYITPELREGIRENRDALIRTLLENRVVLWLEERGIPVGPVLLSTELEAVRLDGSLQEFRDLLRRIASAAIRKGMAA